MHKSIRLVLLGAFFATCFLFTGCEPRATSEPEDTPAAETTPLPAETPEASATPEPAPLPVYETDDITQLSPSLEYTAEGKELFRFASADKDFATVQGTYFNGKNFYVAVVHKDSEGYETARMLLLDKEGNVLKESEPLPLDHANNVTFNTKLNRLVVTHCQSPDGKYDYYSMLDPDTFEITETDYIDRPFFALAYSPEKDMYASGEWGGQTLDTWSGTFYNRKHKDVVEPESLSQGVFCDGEAIYFVRSSQNSHPAEIRIYDWELNFIRSVKLLLQDNVEPESINLVDGKAYVVGTDWNTRTGVCYVLHFKAER